MPNRNRSGLGIVLLLVLVAILLSVVVLFSHQTFFQSVARQHAGEQNRELALEIARSALVEARDRLLKDAARSGTAAFQAFRGGAAAASLPLDTPRAGALAPPPVTVIGTQAKLLTRRALDLTAYETGGIVRLETKVTFGVRARRSLTVAQDYEFKVVNLAPPRPFGKLLLAVSSGQAFLGTDPNRPLREATRALVNLHQLVSGAREKVEERRDRFPELCDHLNHVEREIAAIAPASEDAAPPAGARYFGTRSTLGHEIQVMLPSESSPAALGSLRLADRLSGPESELETARQAFDRASREFQRALHSINILDLLDHDRLVEPGRAYADAALTLARAYHALAAQVLAYQSQVTWIAGADRNHWIADYWPRLLPAAWKRRAFYQVGSVAELQAAPVKDGVFYMKGAGSLTDLVLEGRKVLVVNGPVKIRNLTRGAGSRGMNLLTVIVHGAVELEGTVEASVLVMAPEDGSAATLRLDSSLALHGTLAAGPGVDIPEVTGKITPDPLADSGGFGAPAKEDRYRVALPEAPFAQGVEES